MSLFSLAFGCIWDFIASAESMNSQMPSGCFKTDKGWDGGDSERVAIGPRFVASTSMAGCPRNGPARHDFSCFFHVFHMRVDWIPHWELCNACSAKLTSQFLW